MIKLKFKNIKHTNLHLEFQIKLKLINLKE